MKKFLIVLCFAFFITGFASAQIGPGRVMYVAVKSIDLKSSTGLLAGAVATLKYGDEVTVIKVDGKYVEVISAENSLLTGWTASSNFTTKKITAGTITKASAKEVALAGKGFNQELENSFMADGELNFADVDRVESIKVDEDELMRFLEEGHLSTGK